MQSPPPPFSEQNSLLDEARITHPAIIRRDSSLLQPDRDLAAYLDTELRTPKLDALHNHLWLAGLPVAARTLSRQKLMNRDIAITERPDEHLVWHDGCIFIKPLPEFLLCHAFWEKHLCRGAGDDHDPALYPSAVGLLLSYAWLVQYRSDFNMAREAGLLPEGFGFEAWTALVRDLLGRLDLEAMDPARVDRRYRYGELRLTRLDSITRYMPDRWSAANFVYGHMNFSTRYTTFFETNFGWLLAVFAYVSIVLSALQTGISTEFLSDNWDFQRMTWILSLITVGVSLGSVVLIFGVWFSLLWYHLLSTLAFDRRTEAARRKVIIADE
ncbi:hypothetical protein VPNG_02488 [Cytospora leucostoma]|uniref:Subtilisin-like serine protease n=1 Tax=Cytospora leucostoma TaxID=1230097 RepID=A0A423XHX6_9PEZI|nr:hypothetical protein VPNG_02488 [Cytospora leucostoma]